MITICPDELDKTIAEYDTSVDGSSPVYSFRNNGSDADSVLLASKTKLLANDANAASIRTR